MSQDTIEFRKMTREEFAKFHEDNLEGYARDIARAFKRSIEGERVRAKEQVEGLLPKGIETEGHYSFNVIETKSGNKIGNVWINVDEVKSRAFLFDIVVYEPFRGKGYGRKIMNLMEKMLKEMKISSVELHVFAYNTVAINLYKTQGYDTASFNMQKSI